jgi:xylulokinase
LLLGLDLGTSRVKALLIDADGRVGGSATIDTPFDGGEMSVAQLVKAVRGVIGRLGGEAVVSVAAVGIAGIAESGAPLDRRGQPMAPIIAWHDPRGDQVVDRLQRQFGPDLARWIGQRLRTVSSVAKLGWLVEHGVGPVARWLGVPELVLYALTGRSATDSSLAARTGAYHVGSRSYLPEVAQAIGVTSDVFAAVEPAGAAMGCISADGAAWSGLPFGIPVTIAGHDHLAGLVGSGAGPEDLVNSVGTAEAVVLALATLPDVDRALASRVAVTMMPGGRRWALLASAARSGIVLATVSAALGRSVDDLDQVASGAGWVSVSDALISAAGAGEDIESTLPDAPAGAIWNGVLDALAARTWDAVDRVQEVGGVAAPMARLAGPVSGVGGPVVAEAGRRLVVFGGGSRSQPWLEAKALARPGTAVWRSGAGEAVARGAALYAGVAARWWSAPDDGPSAPLERIVSRARRWRPPSP